MSAQLMCAQVLYAQQKKIKFEGAKSMKNLKIGDRQFIRYIGDARFLYDNTRMLCDSAYLDPKDNSFDAYGHVVIIKDNVKIYGDKLHFEGANSQGKLTGKEVRLVDEDATLVTNTLYFNSKTSYIYYTTGGVINTKDSKLNSQRGYYDKNRSSFSFAGNVEMINVDGTVYTDSLQYNSKSEVAYFFGPTYMYNNSNFIYCEKGWHNSKLEQSNFQQNAYILNGAQKLFGDNIFYDKPNGYARVIGNVVVIDTANNTYAYGDKANYWDIKKEAEITENPYVMMVDKTDTLYLRSDKLFLRTIKDAKAQTADSTYRILKAIGDVKFFRADIQGVCDSMIYNSFDSTLVMYDSPVMWNELNQMSSELITMHSGGETIEQIDFVGSAFIASLEGDKRYNQLNGKSIFARFREGKMTKMDVVGNGQSVYYVKENDTITMVNRVECSNLTVSINNNKVSKIVYREKPVSQLLPIEKAEPEDFTLKGFKWLGEIRPQNKYSIIPETLILFPVEKGKDHPKSIAKPQIQINEDRPEAI